MKTIYILTPPETNDLAERVDTILSYAGYNSNIITKSYEDVYIFVSKITPADCQLIISLDAFGFEKTAPDGGLYFNQTPVNTLAILFRPASNYDSFFNCRINYTTSILTQSKTDMIYLQEHHKHIYNVNWYSSIEELPIYLDNFDWRY